MDNRKDECESPVNTEPASTDGDQNDFTADQTSSESLKLPRHQYTRVAIFAFDDFFQLKFASHFVRGCSRHCLIL